MSICWKSAALIPRAVLMVVLSLGGTACAGSGAGNDWPGVYAYYVDQGRTAGGSAIGTGYTLTIGDDRGDCSLKIHGFQVDQVILCSPEYEPGQADIQFVSYDDGSVKNPYGVQIYEPGEVLFSLEKSEPRLVTIWRSLTPDEVSSETGTFFRKQVPGE